MPTSLLEVRKKMKGRIAELPDDPSLRSQCIRLGLNIGAEFVCIERLPGGTVVAQVGRQEIALGRDLAESILVEVV